MRRRERKLVLRLIGAVMAITGAVIVIHTVPVFVWYIVLVALIIAFVFFMLNT